MPRKKRMTDQEARERTLAAISWLTERLLRTDLGTAVVAGSVLGVVSAGAGAAAGVVLADGSLLPVPDWSVHPGKAILARIGGALPTGHGIPWLPRLRR